MDNKLDNMSLRDEAQPEGKGEAFSPACRLISLDDRLRTPLNICYADPPLCSLDSPVPLCSCVGFQPVTICSLQRSCSMDCGCDMHCSCDMACACLAKCPCLTKCNHCYCDNKGGFSPLDGEAPTGCEAHARTFFRLAEPDKR